MWRNTGLFPKFYFLDARSMIAMLIFALHMTAVTFYIATTGVIFFWIIERMGYSPIVFFRIICGKLFKGNRTLTNPLLNRSRCNF